MGLLVRLEFESFMMKNVSLFASAVNPKNHEELTYLATTLLPQTLKRYMGNHNVFRGLGES